MCKDISKSSCHSKYIPLFYHKRCNFKLVLGPLWLQLPSSEQRSRYMFFKNEKMQLSVNNRSHLCQFDTKLNLKVEAECGWEKKKCITYFYQIKYLNSLYNDQGLSLCFMWDWHRFSFCSLLLSLKYSDLQAVTPRRTLFNYEFWPLFSCWTVSCFNSKTAKRKKRDRTVNLWSKAGFALLGWT